MYATRQTGPVYTSVRGHPIKLLIAAIAALGTGAAILCNPNSIWAIPAGIGFVAAGAWLFRVAARQIGRCARTFFS
jgi:hypothetical protein